MSRLILAIPVFLLTACSLSPGMDMKKDGELSNIEVPTMRDGKLVKEKAAIIPITADLIIERENSKQELINILPTETNFNTVYKIGPHDRLEITVWDHPELNDPGGEKIKPELAGKMIQDDGMLYYPYVGDIQVQGKTIAEVRELLTQGLSKYFKRVKLDVRVLSFQSHRATVVGQVKMPGVVAMNETPLTIAEAISRAGGVTEDADTTNATLARSGKVYKIDVFKLYENGGSEQNLLLKDGDVLNIPDRKENKVFVMGEVGRQQALQLGNGRRMTLAQALAEANGVDVSTSQPEEIFVIRTGERQPEIFQLNADSPDALILADQYQLQKHDTVFVGTAGITQWSRVLNQLLPSSLNSMMTKAAAGI
jgi:polysaccharide export outer membrane protein